MDAYRYVIEVVTVALFVEGFEYGIVEVVKVDVVNAFGYFFVIDVICIVIEI